VERKTMEKGGGVVGERARVNKAWRNEGEKERESLSGGRRHKMRVKGEVKWEIVGERSSEKGG